MAEKIVLDCDPGHDDAIALLLAHGDPGIELLAVTTVVGNQTLAKVTRNALSVATMAGITGVPFAAGADRPLLREIEVAADIHGESGLDGPELPEPAFGVVGAHAVDLIVETVLAHEPGTVTLVPTGGLTNIALAARRAPEIVERVKRVVLMGGGVGVGNRTAVAEFNIAIDPEAADIVFSAGWEVVMVGLDLTHQAVAGPEAREAIRAVGTGPARFVDELLDFFAGTYRDVQGFDAPPVHDPCAVAHVIDPTVVRAVPVPLVVETTGRHTTGMTVADLRGPAPEGCRTYAARDLDHGRFWDLVVGALTRIGDPTVAAPVAVPVAAPVVASEQPA
ncbi:Inosine-uridine preferring nucleoside hydrolase [Pseudonocardia sp. Ae168_Ps1]|uniref:uridine-preferring nucleoside hydrolase UriH n=1 Tax=unclassified Pseudonocardia TaxID=2619320 RepID=UPI00094B73A0|nr:MULTISPECIES: nucleoside hydrolase [unclassified Pseudonocardia]OLL71252.1 Inosine-uridine preferring nucleoside hydrolase [Pseudonocardia sp. Ae168_Ps1]OLL77194.1 Inosine-uridine preferring nucleoside hydrolase [Pseudonocardia sp. Ae150A_Ps1]OLL88698.1 Inosine-uridine preferring nucleoside hydrolase [Pseudonocardia sp. Ae263_Ps1]OLL91281.1 Inosine-uridine preferring nucleoside hydrolase [Pseudonocardia sp. Ae356_Ps1]